MLKTKRSVLIGLLLWTICQNLANGQTLQAQVSINTTNLPIWDYTLTNLEPSTSTNYLTSFFLPINSPVFDVQAPDNWTIETDDSTYILWANIEAYPYPDDIAPGTTVSGFQFQSYAGISTADYTVSSWDHLNDQPGPTMTAATLIPGPPTNVPEPDTYTALVSLVSTGIIFFCHKHRGNKVTSK